MQRPLASDTPRSDILTLAIDVLFTGMEKVILIFFIKIIDIENQQSFVWTLLNHPV